MNEIVEQTAKRIILAKFPEASPERVAAIMEIFRAGYMAYRELEVKPSVTEHATRAIDPGVRVFMGEDGEEHATELYNSDKQG